MASNLIGNGCASALATALLQADRGQHRSIIDRLRIRYGSYWFEKLDKMQSPGPTEVTGSPDPKNLAFVMGFWRSGTTLLHNWVASSSNVKTPLSWQCFNPATHMLRDWNAGSKSVRRPMDDGEAGPLAPQEDEFALLLLGEPSFYRIFLSADNWEDICTETLEGAANTLPRWRRFLCQLQAEGECLLLKSPNHIFRMPMLNREFPDAPMVWVGREFSQVLRSNLDMWLSVAALNSPSPLEPSNAENLLWTLSGAYLNVLRQELSSSTRPHLWIDFHDLCEYPEKAALGAASFLGLPSGSSQPSDDGLLAVRTRQHLQVDPRFSSDRWTERISEVNSCHNDAAKKWAMGS